MPEELLSNCMQTKLQRPLRTSDASALEKRELENLENHFISKDLVSTELSLNSWLKEVTSLPETVLEENQFTV